MANVVVAATSTFNNKGLKKAKKEVSAFEKQVKTYAKTFAAAFSGRALINYSKKAITAFAADEKAAKSLEVQLRNTGFAFSAPGVEQYIARLQGLYGVLDDELRPAFQQLLTATGSITKSQDALQTALNVSAATGRSLSEVSAALTRGFSGNTTGLSRLGAGISKATLKTGNMDKIMEELNAKFAGQAQARLTTYAGKMDLLKVASENVKEEIGKGILGALDALGKDTNIEDTTKKMEELAKQTGDSITGLGVFLKTLSGIPGIGLIGKAFYETSALGLLARLGKENRPTRELPANEQRSAGRISSQQFRIEIRQKKELDRLRALELAALKKKTAVDELRDKFDLERIGLTAALNAATDDETKLRLKAQLAILDNNEALAKKLLAEMEGTKATVELTTQFYALSEAAKALLTSFGVDPSQVGPGGTIIGGLGGRSNIANLANTSINNPNFASSAAGMDLGLALGFTPGSRTGGAAPQEIVVTVNTANAGDRLSQAIAESIQIATKNGYSTVPAGQGF
jgi:hypothetical protein